MQNDKIYNYFYIINNLLNGHFYLGVHSTNDLNDGYFGSGTALKQAIEKYGRDNFKLTILKYFDTRDELLAYESEVVNMRFLEHYHGVCYNQVLGGHGGRLKSLTDEEAKERQRIRSKEWNRRHAERCRARAKEWRDNNRDKYHTNQRNYYQRRQAMKHNAA